MDKEAVPCVVRTKFSYVIEINVNIKRVKLFLLATALTGDIFREKLPQ
jgi:hypothetical protein